MVKKQNIPYFICLAVIFVVFKIAGAQFSISQPVFLIGPTSSLVGLFTSTHFEYIQHTGYVNDKLNIIIDNSCSGFNFLLICFLSLSFSAIVNLSGNVHKTLTIIVIMFFSIAYTIFVNTSRILLSIAIHKMSNFDVEIKAEWMHQAEGTFVYLFFLIVIYLLVSYLLKKHIRHAKPS
jgi:exosortase K